MFKVKKNKPKVKKHITGLTKKDLVNIEVALRCRYESAKDNDDTRDYNNYKKTYLKVYRVYREVV